MISRSSNNNETLAALEESILESDLHSNPEIVRATVETLWPNIPFQDVLKDPLFYEKPVAAIPRLSQEAFQASIPARIADNLSIVDIPYRGFNNETYTGQVIIHTELVEKTQRAFERILTETDFPITSLIPLSFYNNDSSVKYNNSGAFDWRIVKPNEISDHAFGAAIDLNPLLNPWVKEGEPNEYDPHKPGTLHANSAVVRIFKEEGWKWGGDWEHSKDYQHFYAPEIPFKHFGKVEEKE